MSWLDELETKARAATPGPWETYAGHVFKSGDSSANICSASEPRKSRVVGYSPLTCDSEDLAEGYNNARFVAAANPATVLRMVELLREADARLRNHNGAPHESCPYCDFAREFHAKLERGEP